MKKYTESHEWVEVQASIATIGITQFAAEEIGEVAFVELPHVGEVLQKEDMGAVIESSKAAIDIANPISGVVVEVNEALGKQPQLVHASAEDKGWLYRIQLSTPEELRDLLDKPMRV